MEILASWLILTVALLIGAYLLPGVVVAGFVPALIAALVLGLINTFIKPVLLILTLPINIITLGLFTFVISALLIMAAAWVVPGFSVDSFWWALALAVLIAVITAILGIIF